MRKRFIKDFGLEITVVESPYWEHFLDLYDLTEKWINYQRLWYPNLLSDYHNLKQIIISDLSKNRDKILLPKNPLVTSINSGDIYNQEMIGKEFTSIDLRSGGLQALIHYCPSVFPIDLTGLCMNDAWKMLIEYYTKDKNLVSYITQSKTIRQSILGAKELYPGVQTMLEKFMMIEISKLCKNNILRLNNDELILEGHEEFDNIDLDVSIEHFTLKSLKYITPTTGATIQAYLKCFNDGSIKIKKVPKNYYAQVYCDVFNKLRSDLNLYTYLDNELVKFDKPLKMIP